MMLLKQSHIRHGMLKIKLNTLLIIFQMTVIIAPIGVVEPSSALVSAKSVPTKKRLLKQIRLMQELTIG